MSFTLGVPYDTPSESLKQIPALIREVVESTEDTSFSRAHFASFGSYCLNIEVVYFVLSSDFDRYMDINQTVNLGIKEAFERIGVPFAIPTTAVRIVPKTTRASAELMNRNQHDSAKTALVASPFFYLSKEPCFPPDF